MSKLGILLGELLEMKLSGEEMAALVGPLYGKTKEEKEQILEPIIQKMKTDAPVLHPPRCRWKNEQPAGLRAFSERMPRG